VNDDDYIIEEREHHDRFALDREMLEARLPLVPPGVCVRFPDGMLIDKRVPTEPGVYTKVPDPQSMGVWYGIDEHVVPSSPKYPLPSVSRAT
jgi:hypothetical protein